MPSLRDTQQRFADAVFSSEIVSDFVAGSEALARDRIAIYRRTILANYRKALAASYPVIRRLTGVTLFHAAVDAFVQSRARPIEPVNRRLALCRRRWGGPLDLPVAYGPARQLENFECPDDAPHVVAVNPRRRTRIDVPQAAMERLGPLAFSHLG